MRANCSALPAACMPAASCPTLGSALASRELDGGGDALVGARVDRLELRLGDARFAQLRAHAADRVVHLVLGDLVLRAVGEPGVGDRVAAVAVGHRLQHGGRALLARGAQQAVGRLDDRVEVVAVDALAVHAVRARALVQLRLGGGARDRRAHAVLVVDDEEDDRQLPQRGEVERLVPGAHVHGAVAELADDRLRLALAHEREREAGRDRQLAGDDAPAAVVAARDVEQVHRAAAAVRAAVLAAEQLGHHRLGRRCRARARSRASGSR